MNKFFLILAIVALILLFPIPIKIKLTYRNNIFILKLYNKTVLPKTKKSKDKVRNKDYKSKVESEEKKFKLIHGKIILSTLVKNKLKFNLKFSIDIDYGFEDAAKAAISYGFLHGLLSILPSILNLPLNLKKYKYYINMNYNKNFINIEINSIVFINIAKLIYIMVKTIYNLISYEKTSKLVRNNLREEFNNG